MHSTNLQQEKKEGWELLVARFLQLLSEFFLGQGEDFSNFMRLLL
jgi:hypothetical protein